jgi:hypothetical protein
VATPAAEDRLQRLSMLACRDPLDHVQAYRFNFSEVRTLDRVLPQCFHYRQYQFVFAVIRNYRRLSLEPPAVERHSLFRLPLLQNDRLDCQVSTLHINCLHGDFSQFRYTLPSLEGKSGLIRGNSR